jgi:hypothetical protein
MGAGVRGRVRRGIMKPRTDNGGRMSRFENQRALAWLNDALGRLGNDGQPKTESLLRAVRDDLEFEVRLMKRASPADSSSDHVGQRRV